MFKKYKYGKVDLDFILPFGKYKFMSVQEVIEYDPLYLGWCMSSLILNLSRKYRKKIMKQFIEAQIKFRVYSDFDYFDRDDIYFDHFGEC